MIGGRKNHTFELQRLVNIFIYKKFVKFDKFRNIIISQCFTNYPRELPNMSISNI